MSDELAPTMTVPELAKRMGIDQSTAWRYLRAGKLPGVQVSSRWLIDRERVERFLAGKEDAAGHPLVTTEIPSVTPMLELVPRVAQPETNQALAWLRGLMSALELLSAAVETSAEHDARPRPEA